MDCPVCGKKYLSTEIESHVNKCLFLNDDRDNLKNKSLGDNYYKRQFPMGILDKSKLSEPLAKKPKVQQKFSENLSKEDEQRADNPFLKANKSPKKPEQILPDVQQCKGVSTNSKKFRSNDYAPLAEKMRPTGLADYVGQEHILGPKSVLLQLLEKKEIPSMILWGPPGCGKTSLANVISNICKEIPEGGMRFVKLSAAMSGVNDVKEVIHRAANELKFGRRTVMFMDEIHRFNKLQQDIFLPHIEAGTITLVGATTENPCFSLNSSLLSRCRVVVLEKLKTPDLVSIIENAIIFADGQLHSTSAEATSKTNDSYSSQADSSNSTTSAETSSFPMFKIDQATVQWLAETCDGDARIALGGLELAIQSKVPRGQELSHVGPGIITLEDIKDGLKKSHVLYDRKGDQHYDMISALHKSVRASDDNAALYWLARMLAAGEDPLYIARRLIRMASEDVGLADPKALGLAVSVMDGCKMIGMPECDVLLAQCAIYLARAPKSRLVEDAFRLAQGLVTTPNGQKPPVPMHLRGTGSSRLVELLGNGKGYNMLHKNESGLHYLPEGLEDVNFFDNDEQNSFTG